MQKGITKRQKELLNYIYHSIKNEGYPPSLSDLKSLLEVKSNQAVIDLLNALGKNKYIVREAGVARGIIITQAGYNIINLPALLPQLGVSYAGPIATTFQNDLWTTLSKEVKINQDMFLVQICGDSMIDAGIDNGDILVAQRSAGFVNRDIVVAEMQGGTTVKRFMTQNHAPVKFLKPENKKYDIILFTPETKMQAKVIGKQIDGKIIPIDPKLKAFVDFGVKPLVDKSTIATQDIPKINFVTDDDIKVEIEQNDCIKYMQSLSPGLIDIIITDPAYSGMNNKLKLGRGRIVGEYKNKGENGKWFSEFEDSEENYRLFLGECKRVLNKQGHIYLMFDSFSLLTLGSIVREYFDVKNIVTWDKINLGMGHYFRRRHEFIIFATNKNNRNISSRSFPDIWRIKRIHNAKYPTQKPIEVFDMMLKASATKGMNILDPFAGSGSSAIASILNQCNYYGCDISTNAFNITSDRIAHFIKYKNDKLQKNIDLSMVKGLF